jgi:Ran GTPase-activating protein (RanGAP) involved in mRNA processing and transport
MNFPPRHEVDAQSRRRSLEFFADVFAVSPIQDLILCDNPLDSRAIEVLGPVLRGSNLEKIFANGCGLDSSRLHTFLGTLQTTSLRYLGLRENEFGDDAVESVRDFLAQQSMSLTHLDIAYNLLTAAFVRNALVPFLQAENVLTTLTLSGNAIGDDGVQDLMNHLATCPSLYIVRLDNCNIGNAGAAAIANALRRNTSIRFLYLAGNNIEAAEFEALRAALCEENTTLEALEIRREYDRETTTTSTKRIQAELKFYCELNKAGRGDFLIQTNMPEEDTDEDLGYTSWLTRFQTVASSIDGLVDEEGVHVGAISAVDYILSSKPELVAMLLPRQS